MEIVKIKIQDNGYKVTFKDGKEYSIPYVESTFLYKETKEFIENGGSVEPKYTQEELEKEEKAKAKTQKETELNSLTITNNTVLYDAHQEAIGNMSAVIGIANATYIRLISVGTQENGNVPMSAADAYNNVYKQTVNWKGADDKWHTVQLESLVETTQKAMTEKATVLSKY